MEQFWSTLPEHCFSLLMFAGIHLCTALLRLCHSISIGLKCRLWVTAIFWFFSNMASYLVLEYVDYDHCRRSPNPPPPPLCLTGVMSCSCWYVVFGFRQMPKHLHFGLICVMNNIPKVLWFECISVNQTCAAIAALSKQAILIQYFSFSMSFTFVTR